MDIENKIFIMCLVIALLFSGLYIWHIETGCEGNNCCSCGVCNSIWDDCNNCPCRGPDSEGCHYVGWNMSLPECNLSIKEG